MYDDIWRQGTVETSRAAAQEYVTDLEAREHEVRASILRAENRALLDQLTESSESFGVESVVDDLAEALKSNLAYRDITYEIDSFVWMPHTPAMESTTATTPELPTEVRAMRVWQVKWSDELPDAYILAYQRKNDQTLEPVRMAATFVSREGEGDDKQELDKLLLAESAIAQEFKTLEPDLDELEKLDAEELAQLHTRIRRIRWLAARADGLRYWRSRYQKFDKYNWEPVADWYVRRIKGELPDITKYLQAAQGALSPELLEPGIYESADALGDINDLLRPSVEKKNVVGFKRVQQGGAVGHDSWVMGGETQVDKAEEQALLAARLEKLYLPQLAT